VLDVLDVRDALTIGPLEVIGRRSNDLLYDERALPRCGELVHALGVLDASQD
jgi:hypothetical protein